MDGNGGTHTPRCRRPVTSPVERRTPPVTVSFGQAAVGVRRYVDVPAVRKRPRAARQLAW